MPTLPPCLEIVAQQLEHWHLGLNPNAVTVSPAFTSACADVTGLLFQITALVYFPFFFPANCGDPTVPTNGYIYGTYQNTTEGTVIEFGCDSGFVPAGNTTAVCALDGRWIPDPATLVCTCKSTYSFLQYKNLWLGV